MNIRCHYCEYQYAAIPPMAILQVMAAPDIPYEDYMLWMDRLMIYMGPRQFKAMAIHYDVKHKYLGGLFDIVLDDSEKQILHDPALSHAV